MFTVIGLLPAWWAVTGVRERSSAHRLSDLRHKVQGAVIVAVRRGAMVAVVRNTNSGQIYEMVS
jgi:hypothetical protein